MLVGIYTDAHCSYTSSILPLHCEGSKYTTRLQMIIDTFRWMYDLFDAYDVDLIVNCGDLFDSFKLRAEEVSAMAEALQFSKGISEIHVLGNHEVLDKRRNFYATALLNNYSHIDVVTVPTKLDNGLSFLPYMTTDEASECIPWLSNKILFSHIDVKGSLVTPTYELDTGVDSTSLGCYFDLVMNGHLHSPQSLNKVVHNVGACTSLSFSDNSDYTPHICILDTETLERRYFQNPYAIRFRKLDSGIDSLRTHLLSSGRDNREVIRITVPASKRAEAEELLKSDSNVVTYRITSEVEAVETPDILQPSKLDLKGDIASKFVEFLSISNDLNYPIENYLSVVAELSNTQEEQT